MADWKKMMGGEGLTAGLFRTKKTEEAGLAYAGEEDPAAREVCIESEIGENNVIDPSHIFVCSGLGDQAGLFAFVAQKAVELGVARDAAELEQALHDRESQGTTGMMDGFAIPHAKTQTVERAAVLVVKDTEGMIGWDTMDDEPIHVAIALLIPEGHAGADHLRMLSQVAESLMDEEFRAAVKGASTVEEVCEVIGSRLA